MSLTLINLSGYSRGVASEETGINCSKFSVEVEPEINEYLPGITGESIGKAVSSPMARLTIEGEVKGSTGVMAIVAATAFVPANTVTYFGRSAGGFYFDKGTVTESRDGWKEVSVELSSHFLIA